MLDALTLTIKINIYNHCGLVEFIMLRDFLKSIHLIHICFCTLLMHTRLAKEKHMHTKFHTHLAKRKDMYTFKNGVCKKVHMDHVDDFKATQYDVV